MVKILPAVAAAAGTSAPTSAPSTENSNELVLVSLQSMAENLMHNKPRMDEATVLGILAHQKMRVPQEQEKKYRRLARPGFSVFVVLSENAREALTMRDRRSVPGGSIPRRWAAEDRKKNSIPRRWAAEDRKKKSIPRRWAAEDRAKGDHHGLEKQDYAQWPFLCSWCARRNRKPCVVDIPSDK